MKNQLPSYRIVLIITISLLSACLVNAQTLMTENFEYPNGTLLTNVGWTTHSGGGTQAIDVVVPGLSFIGYPLSNIGGAALVDNNGEDVNKTFTVQTSGKVYTAFMVKVTGTADGYFIHLGGDPISTIFRSKIFTTGTTDPFNFGISVGANTATNVAGGAFNFNKTYLFVLKYEIIDGEKNDAVSLYIISDAVPFAEPATPTVGPLTDNSQTDINPGSIAFRQYNATQNITIDGIRIAKSWSEAVTAPLGSDRNPPIFTAGYPKVTNINSTKADLQVSLDEAGKAFYLVVPGGSVTPTATQVFDGTNYGSVTKVANGTIDIDNGGSIKSVTLSGLADKTNYDIYVIAQDDEQPTPNKQVNPVKVSLFTTRPPSVIFSADFNGGTLDPFKQVSIKGDAVWGMYITADIKCPKMTGYSNPTYYENLDYLISPEINLGPYVATKLNFITAKDFTGPALKVLMSTNFNGTYTPTGVNAATWTDISSNFTFSTGSFTFVPSGEYLFPSGTGKVFIAFLYESTTTQATTFEVDNVQVTGDPITRSNFIEESSIHLFPVPAIDQITIDNIEKVKSFEIFDINGKMMHRENCEGYIRKTINISQLSRGVYLIRLTMPQGQQVLKFIKE